MRQQIGGVIGTEDGDASIVMKATAELAEAFARGQQILGGTTSEGDDEAWFHQFELAFQILTAVGRFFFIRRAIAGRATTQDVANIDLFAFHAAGANDTRQELAGLADEWLALLIFGLTGRFADEA